MVPTRPTLARAAIVVVLAQLAHGNPDGDARPLEARLRELAAKRTLVIAHRGDSGTYPENTLPSFRSAASLGADFVELDFHVSKDGVLFCLHDDTLDRTTDVVKEPVDPGDRVDRDERAGKIDAATFTMANLAALDAGAWKDPRFAGTRIPTLEEVLVAIAPESTLMIECKRGAPEALVELLRRLDCVDQVVVQSFDWEFLASVRRIEPRLVLGAIGKGEVTVKHVARLRELDVAFVHWKGTDLELESIERLRRDGRTEWLLFAYTINDALSMAGARALGIDGVTTDEPRRLLEVIDRLDRTTLEKE